MTILGIDHIAIAVPELQEAIRRFSEDFGMSLKGEEDVHEAQTRTAFFPFSSGNIELIHPLDGAGPVEKFLQKRGGGLHHVCFRSDDLDADAERLRKKGYRFLSDAPQPGAHGCRVMFIHPKSCDGLLVEINEAPKSRER